MKKNYLFICFGLLLFLPGFSQHYSLFSQYMFNGLLINPAYAGNSNLIDITVSHRRQWSGLPLSPTTSALSLHAPVKGNKVSLGFVFSDDRIGVTTKQNLNTVYAYRIKMGAASLSFGIQAGLEFSRASWDKLARNDVDDNVLLTVSPTIMNFTTGAGVYFQNKKIFTGLSMPYLLNTGSSAGFLSGPSLLYAGYNVFLPDSSVLKPSILIRGLKGSPTQFDLNLVYSWKQKYGFGLAYRNKESLIALLEFNFSKEIRFCYSYDYGVGAIKAYHNGSHEITFRYLFSRSSGQNKEKKTSENTPQSTTTTK